MGLLALHCSHLEESSHICEVCKTPLPYVLQPYYYVNVLYTCISDISAVFSDPTFSLFGSHRPTFYRILKHLWRVHEITVNRRYESQNYITIFSMHEKP